MTHQKKHTVVENIPQKKILAVKELADLSKTKKTLLLASIKGIPAAQFQEISKKFRGKAIIRVPKKNLTLRVIDQIKDENLSKIKSSVGDNVAVIFSDLDSFDLAADLLHNKTPTKAKPGQHAPVDIEIPAGPTGLLPGPDITELGNLGIPIQIDKGKITIKESKIVAKKGEKISKGAAEIMNKLEIKPFNVGFTPISSFDFHEKKFYSEMNIDQEGTLHELKQQFGKSLALAVEIGYASQDTINFLLMKAFAHNSAIEKLVKTGSESISENTQQNKSEDKEE